MIKLFCDCVAVASHLNIRTAVYRRSLMRVTPPPPLQTAYRSILALRTAYCIFWPRVLRIPFNNKKQPFWAFPFT